MKKLNESKKILILQLALVFFIAFVANSYTYYKGDDYTYMYSFKTKEAMTSLSDYIESIVVHTQVNNGRYIAHFLAQLMLNIPKQIFNIINAIIYTLQIFLCYKICLLGKKQVNNILFFGLFGAIFVYEPMFGEVNIWLTGSCNYLWGIVVVLFFVLQYVKMGCDYEGEKHKMPYYIFFVVFAFIAGAYIESTSATGIFIAFFVIVAVLIRRKKINIWYVIALAVALLGYASMLFSPAELNHTTGEMSFYRLKNNFIHCVNLYYGYKEILIIYIILLVVCIKKHVAKKEIVFSLLFISASIFSAMMFLFATYVPGRGYAAAAVTLIISCGILVNAIFSADKDIVSIIIPLIILPSLIYNLIVGIDDIHDTYSCAKQAAAYVEYCKRNGDLDVEFPLIQGKTTYSQYYDSSYQIMPYPEQWPNLFMAKYFGVDGIYGVQPEEFDYSNLYEVK